MIFNTFLWWPLSVPIQVLVANHDGGQLLGDCISDISASKGCIGFDSHRQRRSVHARWCWRQKCGDPTIPKSQGPRSVGSIRMVIMLFFMDYQKGSEISREIFFSLVRNDQRDKVEMMLESWKSFIIWQSFCESRIWHFNYFLCGAPLYIRMIFKNFENLISRKQVYEVWFW